MLELLRLRLALVLCVLLPGLGQARAQHTSSPPTDGEAIEVEVSFALLDLFRVLDAEQAVEADVLYRLDWRDVRLAEPGVDQRTFDLDQVWYPDLQPLSPRGVSGLMPDQVTVDEEGNVRLVRRLTGRFGAPTDLHDFPFDSHALGLDFVLTNRLGKVPVRMRQGPIVEVAESLTVPDWTVGAATLDLAPRRLIRGLPEIPSARLVVAARRDTSYYITKVLLPLVVIVMISWTVFWVPPPQIGVQFGFAATSLLNVIAYRFALANQLPRVPYSTRMDVFLTGSFLLVALALVEVVVTAQLLHKQRDSTALAVDVGCRIVFPMLLLGLVGYAFLV